MFFLQVIPTTCNFITTQTPGRCQAAQRGPDENRKGTHFPLPVENSSFLPVFLTTQITCASNRKMYRFFQCFTTIFIEDHQQNQPIFHQGGSSYGTDPSSAGQVEKVGRFFSTVKKLGQKRVTCCCFFLPRSVEENL